MKVKLDDLVKHFNLAGESHKFYLNRSTGEIHLIPVEAETYADNDESDEDDLPGHEKEFVSVYKDISTNPEKYTELPDRFDINMHSIMERFALSLREEKIRKEIYYILIAKGAVGGFREAIEKFGISDKWYSYKIQALRELAVVWCMENDLEYY